MTSSGRARPSQDRRRLIFGLIAAGVFLGVLIFRTTGVFNLDEVGVTLLVLSAGGTLFAFARSLGIAKLVAGPLEIEMAVAVKDAIAALSSYEAEAVQRVLERESELFPVTGVRVLWVDDKPERLVSHRRLLRRIGMEVVSVLSTQDAQRELQRDGEFTLIIQDRLRGGVDDAIALVAWVRGENGVRYKVDEVPIVVFTFDQFDSSICVERRDWITREPSLLLERIVAEIRQSRERPSGAGKKPA